MKKITLDESQREAIKSAFLNKLTVITGPGGSGKSTICRYIYEVACELGMSVRMMSPTGKAAQVLSSKTGAPASTIHRSLKMKIDESGTTRETIREDILLIDEISMSGIDTMNAIMQALEFNTYANIVFVGDKNQLPSVSPGNFLSDIMESGCANVVTLNKIHRQDEDSYISLIANEISKGKVTPIPDCAKDIKWRNLHVDTFNEDLLVFVDQYLKTEKIDDLQIISPMKKGPCGVYKINEIMQKKMAEINGTETDSIVFGFQKFYRGDRVIQIENNYEKNVFNGDMGVIIDLGERVEDPGVSDKKEKFVTVKIYNEEIEYCGEEADQLLLAWASTIHKYQGSQIKNIILILSEEAQVMMNKEILYTGLTRAEKKVDIFGHESMFRLAPTRSSVKKRYTNMKCIMKQFGSSEKVLEVLALPIEKKSEK